MNLTFVCVACVTLSLAACVVDHGTADPGDRVRAHTRPAVITLQVLSNVDFTALGLPVNADAATYVDESPCRIVLREGMLLEGDTLSTRAHFYHSIDADTVAHELLHCYLGRWHTS